MRVSEWISCWMDKLTNPQPYMTRPLPPHSPLASPCRRGPRSFIWRRPPTRTSGPTRSGSPPASRCVSYRLISYHVMTHDAALRSYHSSVLTVGSLPSSSPPRRILNGRARPSLGTLPRAPSASPSAPVRYLYLSICMCVYISSIHSLFHSFIDFMHSINQPTYQHSTNLHCQPT